MPTEPKTIMGFPFVERDWLPPAPVDHPLIKLGKFSDYQGIRFYVSNNPSVWICVQALETAENRGDFETALEIVRVIEMLESDDARQQVWRAVWRRDGDTLQKV